MRLVYLDNALVSAVAKQEFWVDLTALSELFRLSAQGAFGLVTSEVTLREIERCRNPQTKIEILSVYDGLAKVTLVEKERLLGFSSNWGEHGGWSNPIIENDSQWLRLRQLGLSDTDAHHVMVAIRAGCSSFLTIDHRSILQKRESVHQEFAIRLERPSEFLASHGSPQQS